MPVDLTVPVSADDHVRAPENADLELVMYGDFECPYCAATQGIIARVERRLEGRLVLAFRHFPVESVHPRAELAAEAAEAAAAQGAFWPMHDALYAAQGRLAEDDLVRAARSVGLDRKRFTDELRSGMHRERVQRDLASGRASGVTGTPAFFANGRRLSGAFDASSLVEALRAV